MIARYDFSQVNKLETRSTPSIPVQKVSKSAFTSQKSNVAKQSEATLLVWGVLAGAAVVFFLANFLF